MTELPLYMKDFFGRETGLVMGALIGFAFGFVLERAGFGRATILAAQFYFKDMRVLKVMFTAIVTALLGMTILEGVGVLDVAAISIPHTYLWPQLAGGILLGIGFITSGYCPGTGLVATASGKLDGLAAIFGVVLGSILFGIGFPLYADFYHSGDFGVLRFPDLLGVPAAIVAVAVTLMAIGMFIGGEKLERIFTGRDRETAAYLRVSRPVFVGLFVFSVVGVASIFTPRAVHTEQERNLGTISPVEFAQLAIESPQSYYLVDLRNVPEDTKRIPGALALPADDPEAAFVADLPATRTLVIYTQSGDAEIPRSLDAFEGDVLLIEGGYDGFAAAILEAPVVSDDATTEEIEDYRLRSALHAYFTGSSVKSAPPPRPRMQIKRAGKKEGGC